MIPYTSGDVVLYFTFFRSVIFADSDHRRQMGFRQEIFPSVVQMSIVFILLLRIKTINDVIDSPIYLWRKSLLHPILPKNHVTAYVPSPHRIRQIFIVGLGLQKF